MEWTVHLSHATLAVLSGLVARRSTHHRPVAIFIGWLFGTDLLRLALQASRQGAPKPYGGWVRVAFHVDEFIVLSWYFLFVAICLHYFLAKRPWAAVGGWLATFAVCLNYPSVSGSALSWIYRGAAIGGFGASWGCIAVGMLFRRDLRPRFAHLIVILYAASDTVAYLIPYARGFVVDWPLVQLNNLFLYLACMVLHIGWLVQYSRPETSS